MRRLLLALLALLALTTAGCSHGPKANEACRHHGGVRYAVPSQYTHYLDVTCEDGHYQETST